MHTLSASLLMEVLSFNITIKKEKIRCVCVSDIYYCVLFCLLLVVMQSEGFKQLEETCPSLLSEMLKAFAFVDDNSISNSEGGLIPRPNRKRTSSSSSSPLAIEVLPPLHGTAAEDNIGRRLRRRLA